MAKDEELEDILSSKEVPVEEDNEEETEKESIDEAEEDSPSQISQTNFSESHIFSPVLEQEFSAEGLPPQGVENLEKDLQEVNTLEQGTKQPTTNELYHDVTEAYKTEVPSQSTETGSIRTLHEEVRIQDRIIPQTQPNLQQVGQWNPTGASTEDEHIMYHAKLEKGDLKMPWESADENIKKYDLKR